LAGSNAGPGSRQTLAQLPLRCHEWPRTWFLGIDPYLKRRSDLIKRAKAWIFFGSDIGAPRQPSLIHAPDDALEQWALTALKNERLAVDATEQHSSMARGETGTATVEQK